MYGSYVIYPHEGYPYERAWLSSTSQGRQFSHQLHKLGQVQAQPFQDIHYVMQQLHIAVADTDRYLGFAVAAAFCCLLRVCASPDDVERLCQTLDLQQLQQLAEAAGADGLNAAARAALLRVRGLCVCVCWGVCVDIAALLEGCTRQHGRGKQHISTSCVSAWLENLYSSRTLLQLTHLAYSIVCWTRSYQCSRFSCM